jgi:hypothetical protein
MNVSNQNSVIKKFILIKSNNELKNLLRFGTISNIF